MSFEYRVVLTVWDGSQIAVGAPGTAPGTGAIVFASPEEAEEVAAGYRARRAKLLRTLADLDGDRSGALEKMRAATYTVQRRTVGPWIDVTP